MEVFWGFFPNVKEKTQAELGLHLKHWLALSSYVPSQKTGGLVSIFKWEGKH